MTQVKTRKQRVMFSVEQKLDYVKLMVNEGYTNRQIIDISGAVKWDPILGQLLKTIFYV